MGSAASSSATGAEKYVAAAVGEGTPLRKPPLAAGFARVANGTAAHVVSTADKQVALALKRQRLLSPE